MRRILVGTDFSAAGGRAAQTAAVWARKVGAQLRIVHIIPPKRRLVGLWGTDMATVSSAHRNAQRALEELAATLDPERQAELSTGLVAGAASTELSRAARAYDADLLIVGAWGEHETAERRRSIGGTATKLVTMSPVPLLLVRRLAPDPPRTVLAAVDLSPVSSKVLEWACRSATAASHIFAFHAFEPAFAPRLEAYGTAPDAIALYATEEQMRREGQVNSLITLARGFVRDAADCRMEGIVERGDPIDRIFGKLKELEPELVVVGGHRRGRPRSLGMAAGGDVSRHTALFAPTNVLVVQPDQLASDR